MIYLRDECSRRVAYLPDFLMGLKHDWPKIELKVFLRRIELKLEWLIGLEECYTVLMDPSSNHG